MTGTKHTHPHQDARACDSCGVRVENKPVSCANERHNSTWLKTKTRNAQYHLSKDKYRHIFQAYGLTQEEYDKMWEKQDFGKCAICGVRKKLVVDHDHRTEKVRGLLCYRCNIAVGYIESKLLYEVLAYLQGEKDFSVKKHLIRIYGKAGLRTRS